MKSYKQAVKSIGIRKKHFMQWAKENDLEIYYKYDREYQTEIYHEQIRSNVIKFLEFKIKDLQETLKKMKDV